MKILVGTSPEERRDDWRDHKFAEMVGQPVQVEIACNCTKVSICPPSYFIARLGGEATPHDAARRMRCRTCHQRPRLTLERRWTVSEPAPLPAWMGL